MNINDAIEIIWQKKRYESTSSTEVLSHLNEEVAESLKAMLRGDKEKAQLELEDALSCMLIAFKMLEINPEEAINRQVDRMQSYQEKTMHIFSDRVEIKVGDKIKGGWALWSPEDLADAFKVAQEFNCKVIKEEPISLESLKEEDIEYNNAEKI